MTYKAKVWFGLAQKVYEEYHEALKFWEYSYRQILTHYFFALVSRGHLTASTTYSIQPAE
jgi:hypothetical protein